ncbi:hypothetical protein BCR41DRAFT_373234 [Lobosporangium transversale]|uniref:Uncharacterized protein n=1 Tax=Lobosporangium transversale TaxID=64571 RepID=A0A1Y2GEG3_9FUNG|nr:hypothetical protein BCR41DRAFT_373234 [Lobosporangium transversale]ORZ08535.1 hypothetical protein BCR41DRAFT_373234 [Lobosporangium transversale]|eukprot:XP_021878463.1 hypothetical protein BCR41DRAFT_373234 [Lobosporangium transversale]
MAVSVSIADGPTVAIVDSGPSSPFVGLCAKSECACSGIREIIPEEEAEETEEDVGGDKLGANHGEDDESAENDPQDQHPRAVKHYVGEYSLYSNGALSPDCEGESGEMARVHKVVGSGENMTRAAVVVAVGSSLLSWVVLSDDTTAVAWSAGCVLEPVWCSETGAVRLLLKSVSSPAEDVDDEIPDKKIIGVEPGLDSKISWTLLKSRYMLRLRLVAAAAVGPSDMSVSLSRSSSSSSSASPSTPSL